jgi:hypothetical protein
MLETVKKQIPTLITMVVALSLFQIAVQPMINKVKIAPPATA